jgi:hypothetical protein
VRVEFFWLFFGSSHWDRSPAVSEKSSFLIGRTDLVRRVVGVREKAGINDGNLDALPGRARRHFQKVTNFPVRDAMRVMRRYGCARREEMRRRNENEIVDVLAHGRAYRQQLRRRDEKVARARLGEIRRERLGGAKREALRPRLQGEPNLEHVADETRRS